MEQSAQKILSCYNIFKLFFKVIKNVLFYFSVTTSTIERSFKVIVVGDATVGKTSFVQRCVNDVFKDDYKGTVGGKIYNIIFSMI